MQDPSEMQTLSDAELDAVAAGATANLAIGSIFASGPGSADVGGFGVGVQTSVVGGLTPVQQALISGLFYSSSTF